MQTFVVHDSGLYLASSDPTADLPHGRAPSGRASPPRRARLRCIVPAPPPCRFPVVPSPRVPAPPGTWHSATPRHRFPGVPTRDCRRCIEKSALLAIPSPRTPGTPPAPGEVCRHPVSPYSRSPALPSTGGRFSSGASRFSVLESPLPRIPAFPLPRPPATLRRTVTVTN